MYHIVVQRVNRKSSVPSATHLKRWAQAVLKRKTQAAELTIRVVGIDEMTELNSTYRHKNGPTNVLSFPFDAPKDIELDIPILGDIVICAEVVQQEAHDQAKIPVAHWAHMVVHGTLHLLGYDHEEDAAAEIMEAIEVEILQSLGFENPYYER